MMFKSYVYTKNEPVKCTRREFIRLRALGYTQCVNLPGNLADNIELGNYYNIVCLDHRLDSHVADLCSIARNVSV